MRKVEVSIYNNEWDKKFKSEAKNLKAVFGDQMVEIHHIGSTSVKGLKAKPIIDIMPVVKNIKKVDQYNREMIDLGYEPKGENGLPGRRYFQKGGENRTFHVHIYEQGNPEIERHLVFRDFLRCHPNEVKLYGDLKEELAKRFPYDIESYIQGKHPFVVEMERKALAWFRNCDTNNL